MMCYRTEVDEAVNIVNMSTERMQHFFLVELGMGTTFTEYRSKAYNNAKFQTTI